MGEGPFRESAKFETPVQLRQHPGSGGELRLLCLHGGIGRHARIRIWFANAIEGSSPSGGIAPAGYPNGNLLLQAFVGLKQKSGLGF